MPFSNKNRKRTFKSLTTNHRFGFEGRGSVLRSSGDTFAGERGSALKPVQDESPCKSCDNDCPDVSDEQEQLRILYIEDNAADAFLLMRELRHLYPCSVAVRASTNGEGLRLLREGEEFQLILTDLYLPDVNHLEGVKSLLAQAPTTPVVVLTGDENGIPREILSLGAQDCLRKTDAHGRVLKRVLDHARHRSRLVSELRQLSMTDSLTGAHNRIGLLAELEQALANDTVPVTLLLMDLDRFKAVNDTFGHPVGDQVLCDVTSRMRELVGDGCLARLGGDEYAVVLRGWPAGSVTRLCEALQVAIDEPFVYDDVVAEIGVSIGVAVGEPGEVASAVMTRADEAMYAVKHRRTAAALPAAGSAPLYDFDGQMCGIGVCPDVSGRWSMAIATHWIRLAAQKAEQSGQPVFLFVPGEALPELAAVLDDGVIPAGRVCLMVSGTEWLDEPASLVDAIREAGVGVGIAGMGSAQCGVSVLLHFQADAVMLDASLMVAAHPLAQVVLEGVLVACQAAGVPVLRPPDASLCSGQAQEARACPDGGGVVIPVH